MIGFRASQNLALFAAAVAFGAVLGGSIEALRPVASTIDPRAWCFTLPAADDFSACVQQAEAAMFSVEDAR